MTLSHKKTSDKSTGIDIDFMLTTQTVSSS